MSTPLCDICLFREKTKCNWCDLQIAPMYFDAKGRWLSFVKKGDPLRKGTEERHVPPCGGVHWEKNAPRQLS